ncbi:MAG TPA: ABC transporter permease [Solirubrobacterales bacterium]|nr:ABC transporter permease [Solirubrobacterales bacterium]
MSAVGARPAAQIERRLPGPSALGEGWRRTWEVVRLNAVADFQQRYAGSTLGYLWTLIRPITLFGILYVVITQIFARFTDIPFYGSMLLFNIMLFTFFSEAVSGGLRSLGTGQLIRKAELPVIAMPLSTILSTTITFGTNMLVVVLWILIAGVEPTATWLLLPVVVLLLVVLTIGSSLLLSALWVRHRDVTQAWPSISRLLFYATPILFPLEVVPEGVLEDLQSVNPLAPIIAEARVWIIDPSAPGWFADRGTFAALLPIAIGIGICVAGVLAFNRRARTAGEEI